MAAIEPPYACQGRTDHPAQLFRMALAGTAGAPMAFGSTFPVGGVDPFLGQALQVGGLASMNVSVGTGLVYIPNTTAWNGVYAGYSNASFNVALAAASGTQYRRDYIVAQVTDPGDATANWNVVPVAGTFSASAPGALPALPLNSIPLAIVAVTPNMTVTNAGGTISDARIYNALRGVWPTTSSARPPTTSPSGTMWFETDTNTLGIVVNGAYRFVPYSAIGSSQQILQVTKPANTTRTTTTASIDPDLQLVLPSSSQWKVDLQLYYQCASTTPNFKWTPWTYPSGSTGIYTATYFTTAGVLISEADFYNDASHAANVPSANKNYVVVITGRLNIGANSGTFGLNWAADSTAGAMTLSQFSTMVLTRIG